MECICIPGQRHTCCSHSQAHNLHHVEAQLPKGKRRAEKKIVNDEAMIKLLPPLALH